MDPVVQASLIAVIGGFLGIVLGAWIGARGALRVAQESRDEARYTRFAERVFTLADALLRTTDRLHFDAWELVMQKIAVEAGDQPASSVKRLPHPAEIHSAVVSLGLVSAMVEAKAKALETTTMRVAQLARERSPEGDAPLEDDYDWEAEWRTTTGDWSVAKRAFIDQVTTELGVSRSNTGQVGASGTA
jgi:hypothetical protein